MQTIWNNIRNLIARGEVRISEHGYDELAEDGLTVREIMVGEENEKKKSYKNGL